eukprot:scaffold27210_cov66-Phaeocystis_antarctica.AAC.2
MIESDRRPVSRWVRRTAAIASRHTRHNHGCFSHGFQLRLRDEPAPLLEVEGFLDAHVLFDEDARQHEQPSDPHERVVQLGRARAVTHQPVHYLARASMHVQHGVVGLLELVEGPVQPEAHDEGDHHLKRQEQSPIEPRHRGRVEPVQRYHNPSDARQRHRAVNYMRNRTTAPRKHDAPELLRLVRDGHRGHEPSGARAGALRAGPVPAGRKTNLKECWSRRV